MMKLQKTTIFWIGGIVIALSTFFRENLMPQENLVTTTNINITPDYFIINLDAKEFDVTGSLIESLSAKKGLHYTKEARTLLTLPQVRKNEKTGEWEAKGKKGIIEDGSHDILIIGEATAVKHYKTSPNITLHADNMHYLDNDKTLTSTGNAKLHSTQGKTSANTIITYTNSKQVKMTGSVKGKYETTQ